LQPEVFVLLAVLAVGCGDRDIGDDCETPGSEDECVELGVCDRRDDGEVVCLLRCESQSDCEDDQSCNGVTGASGIKACHPK
jgi:hypothetical protein